MERARLAVAVVFDSETAAFVDALRAAVGEQRLDRIPPHITLVPPVDVPVADLVEVWEGLREAVASAPPAIEVDLGPVATFAPRTSTIHLDVHGVEPAADDALRALREAVRLPALTRRDRHGFHPHATLTSRASAERIDAALVAFEGLRRRTVLDRIALLRHDAGPPGRWHTAGEARLGPRRSVVRGVGALGLDVSAVRDPGVAAFWERTVAASPKELSPPPEPGSDSLTVSARDGRTVVGAAECRALPSVVEVCCLAVAPSRWREGIGRLLLDEAAEVAASRGAERLALLPSAEVPEPVAQAWGLTALPSGGWGRPV